MTITFFELLGSVIGREIDFIADLFKHGSG